MLDIPAPREDWALFLDIDGTLIDIADSPDTVVIPKLLTIILASAARAVGGALALVSGRKLQDIDRIVTPLKLPCASEHGAVLRLPDGTIEAFDERHPVPLVWRQRLHKAVKDWAGVYTEDKPYNVVVHYRAAPERKSDVAALVDAIVSEGQEDFEILPARMAYEIRHRALNKGSVVKRLMMLPPFRSRRPVFIGDDVTDDDGFRAAEEMGGFGLNVEEAFGGDTAHVRRWLESFSENVHQAARP